MFRALIVVQVFYDEKFEETRDLSTVFGITGFSIPSSAKYEGSVVL